MLSLSKFFVVLLVVGRSIALPLVLDYDPGAYSAEEKANKKRLDDATPVANDFIKNMRTGFDKSQAGDLKAKAAYEAAFGQKSDPNAVNNVIKSLEKDTLQVDPQTHKFPEAQKNALAAVESTPIFQGEGKTVVMHQPAQFSAAFHGTDTSNPHLNLNDNANRALTMIHEHTHQNSNTGDYVNGDGTKINRLDDGIQERNGQNGYSTHTTKYPFTVDDINKDTKYTSVRDKISNTHDNADAYSVFAGLCSTSLRRRDLELFTRALEEGDDELLEDLMRRNPECTKQKKPDAAKDAPKPAPGKPTVTRSLSTDSSGSKKATSEGTKQVASPARGGADNKPVPGRPALPQKEAAVKTASPIQTRKDSVKPPTSAVKPPTSAVKPPTSAVKPPTSAVKPPTSPVKPPTSAVKPPSSAAKPVTPPPSKANVSNPQADRKSPVPPAPPKVVGKPIKR